MSVYEGSKMQEADEDRKRQNRLRTEDYRKRKSEGLPLVSELRERPHGEMNSPDYNASVRMFHKYGITISDYNKMFESQEGRCAICSRHQTEISEKLHVDHDHSTGKVRGLLCRQCNYGIGNFKDNQELLLNAVDYLTKHSS